MKCERSLPGSFIGVDTRDPSPQTSKLARAAKAPCALPRLPEPRAPRADSWSSRGSSHALRLQCRLALGVSSVSASTTEEARLEPSSRLRSFEGRHRSISSPASAVSRPESGRFRGGGRPPSRDASTVQGVPAQGLYALPSAFPQFKCPCRCRRERLPDVARVYEQRLDDTAVTLFTGGDELLVHPRESPAPRERHHDEL